MDCLLVDWPWRYVQLIRGVGGIHGQHSLIDGDRRLQHTICEGTTMVTLHRAVVGAQHSQVL